MAATSPVLAMLDFHGEREPVPQFQTADFAGVHGAYVLEELRNLSFQLEVPRRRLVRSRVHGTELDAAHCRGPRIKYQLTAFDPQRLEPAKTDGMHLVQEPAFRR
jgi:hypothetical protein